jgi:hypothetical protein
VLVLEISALVLALAATAQAIRTGVRRGDWLPVLVIAGICVAGVAFYLALKAGGD